MRKSGRGRSVPRSRGGAQARRSAETGGARRRRAPRAGDRGGHPQSRSGRAHGRSRLGSGLVIRFDCVTLFPEAFAAVTDSGVTRRALEHGLWSLSLWNPRDFTTDNYRTVDDRPYGGGPGMVMLAEPLERTLNAVKTAGGGRVFYLSPQGRRLDHRRVMELSGEKAVTLLCGRYEGVDERLL